MTTVLESADDQWRMPVTSGVTPGFKSGGGEVSTGASSAGERGTAGRFVLALALMDCSAWRNFQIHTHPRPIAIRTRADVSKTFTQGRSAAGRDPGASIGTPLGSSFGSGIESRTCSLGVACSV